MDLITFISDGPRKQALAIKTQSSAGYLWQIATGWRGKRASPELAQAIEQGSAEIGPESVPKESLRPDIWPPSSEQPLARRCTAAPQTGDAAATTPSVPMKKVA